MTDKELLERIKKDPSEFSVLFREYYRMIFGYVFRRVTDFDISKDIVSDAFRKAFTHIKYFDYRGISVKVWLYRIAANELNLYELRLIHGKGKSKLKYACYVALKDNPHVLKYYDAPPERGGWGATIIELKQ